MPRDLLGSEATRPKDTSRPGCRIFWVTTAQEGEPQPFRFVVVGDTRTDGAETSVGWDVLTQLVVDMNTDNTTLGGIGHASCPLAQRPGMGVRLNRYGESPSRAERVARTNSSLMPGPLITLPRTSSRRLAKGLGGLAGPFLE